jgi:hypothetical protein
LSNFYDAGRAAKDPKSLLALNRAAVCGVFVFGAVFRVFPDVRPDTSLGRFQKRGRWKGQMRFRVVAARAGAARPSPKTESEDQLRIAKEILEALRAAGWNAELDHGATGLADTRLN